SEPDSIVATQCGQSGRPLTGPLSSGVRNRRRVEASEDSRLSVHAHPVFRSLGCTSGADAHQTPIWIRDGSATREEVGASALASWDPQKFLGTRRRSKESHSARARRGTASQSVGDSATRRIEPTTVDGAMPGRIIIRVVLHQSAYRSTQAGRTVATRTG